MGQRHKKLDTEGETPKFLYAILKQMDMKIIDWNRVASDLEISNGHAARMRYSRFRTQMEPAKKPKKKNTKKGEKGNSKVEMSMHMPMPMPMPFQMPHAGPVPKVESTEPPFQGSSLVKYEPGSQNGPGGCHGLPDVSEIHHPFAQMICPGSMPPPPHMPQYMPHGMPFSMMPDMSPSMPSSSHSPFGPSYSPVCLSQDVTMQDFSLQQPIFNNAPVITWGPPTPPQCESSPVNNESTPVKGDSAPLDVEDGPEVVEKSIESDVAVKMEDVQQI